MYSIDFAHSERDLTPLVFRKADRIYLLMRRLCVKYTTGNSYVVCTRV